MNRNITAILIPVLISYTAHINIFVSYFFLVFFVLFSGNVQGVTQTMTVNFEFIYDI